MLRLFQRPLFNQERIGIRPYLSVAQLHNACGVLLRQLRVVGDHDDKTVLRHLPEKIHDLHAGIAVQRPGGFVRQQDIRIVHERPGDRHPLHLSAGHLVRLLVELISQPHFLKRFHSPLPALCLPDAGDGQRQLHIRQDCLVRDQVIALEHEADRVVPVGIPVSVLIFLRGDAVDDHIPAVIAVQSSYNIQKRRLPRPAGTEDGDKFIVS